MERATLRVQCLRGGRDRAVVEGELGLLHALGRVATAGRGTACTVFGRSGAPGSSWSSSRAGACPSATAVQAQVMRLPEVLGRPSRGSDRRCTRPARRRPTWRRQGRPANLPPRERRGGGSGAADARRLRGHRPRGIKLAGGVNLDDAIVELGDANLAGGDQTQVRPNPGGTPRPRLATTQRRGSSPSSSSPRGRCAPSGGHRSPSRPRRPSAPSRWSTRVPAGSQAGGSRPRRPGRRGPASERCRSGGWRPTTPRCARACAGRGGRRPPRDCRRGPWR